MHPEQAPQRNLREALAPVRSGQVNFGRTRPGLPLLRQDLDPETSIHFVGQLDQIESRRSDALPALETGHNRSGYQCQPCRPVVEKLEDVLPVIWNELSPAAREVIDRQGVVYTDEEGDLVTSIVNGKDCVFTCYDEKKCCYCAIEKAYREGKTDFYKPVSCHLYPIRIGKCGSYKALNYHQWDVCKAAVVWGNKKNIPVYRFLQEPLVRKFGKEWYEELVKVAEELKKQHLI